MRIFVFILVAILSWTVPAHAQNKNQSFQNDITNEMDGWTLIWEDSFDKKRLDRSKWNIIERNKADWGNYMSSKKGLIRIRDEKLHLRGIVNKKRKHDTVPFLTGGIDSKGKFAFQYGKIEIHAKLEQAQGAWPALWMLANKPKYGEYPRNGEIDLMEHLNFENKIYQTVHSYYTLELNGEGNPPNSATPEANTAKFNTYGMEWYPDKLVFTLNGKETFTYPKLENVNAAQWPFDQPFYIMMDMQLGGKWVGQVEPKDLPVQMIIDWVKVYKQK
ncbi:glycoside hydrolase family 16 protein [Maribacter halichondriae]|uniref:glycoside hydrolase family 16 protein n=1 Tax=Maribacter halichondriae TaxID=2980554 RepID=UPI0023592D38|nr:glycoside hydrolase family 16 protein [Maribacter sp. Hal144]